ncbi:Por secretion system C-terminal sorting domain-containing protein [Flavobacterium sp. 9AF]|uniref:T9SS type A sorting domain-containing protein n=1 Tax=Flavobacterium sp. 9AF TaxID=2653142 RepID=UPI0012F0CB19|nr:T9SS type A sorting domain-containing protein [Flavobacterium sp. 9AF]VXB05508.1 Por secretion system C-terminal sorting domain-containing protein [Flavobacterium sp. 9AF]
MRKYYFFLALMISNLSISQDLELKGIIDFTVPSGSNNGKAIHLHVINAISDLSVYGIGVANNGGGTDGQEYTFPAIPANAGDHILLPRNTVAIEAYLESLNHFAIVIEDGIATQNGDDAIELFYNGNVIETFGDVDCQASADGVTVTCPNYQYYEDAWAYKQGSTWIYGSAQCTDNSTTSSSSACPYPFLDPALSTTNFEKHSFVVFPNPSNMGQINIYPSMEGFKNISIYDTNGRKVWEQYTSNNTLNINTINKGFYIIKITQDNKTTSSKIILK